MGELDGKRLLVVGASSGLGRAVSVAAARRGASVCLAARRAERLRALAEELHGAPVAVGDVRREADCQRIAAEAAKALGGLDGLVYAAGIIPLARMVQADAAHWRDVFETNVFGAVQVTRACLARFREGAVAAFLSSDTVGRPRQGLGAYSASKAALDESIRSWRIEHPELRFLRLVIGPTLGTEAGERFSPELAAELIPQWLAHGFMSARQMQAEDLGGFIADTLATCFAHPGIALEDLKLEPPGPLQTG